MARKITGLFKSRPTVEGAGVHLKRAFGYHQVPLFDPFLLLDDFHSQNPLDYVAGFPWHPHRGIETITYILEGRVEHGDSLGNSGAIGPGDVQWMTAGSGVIHQEMPKKTGSGLLWGFQLWANLPASQKMMNPRYRDIKAATIPEVRLPGGARARIISGEAGGVWGPVRDIVIDPLYMDVSVEGGVFVQRVKEGHTVGVYVLSGEGVFGEAEGSGGKTSAGPESLILYGHEGGPIEATPLSPSLRFLLFSGKPLREPVAWGGPIVMNTEEELEVAFEEYRNGTFIK
ncbi:pirin family protein [bacterium]|nr:MAG: pirin family protein [bacterium]